MRSVVGIIAGQEIRSRIRTKSFLWSSGILVVAAVLSVVAAFMLSDSETEYDVAVVDPASAAVVESASAVLSAGDEDTTAVAETVDTVAAAERLVEDGDVDAALLATDGGFEVVGNADVEPELGSALAIAVQTVVVEQNAETQDIDLSALNQGTAVDTRMLDPNADESGERGAVAFIMVLLFFGVALTFGMMIAQSVTVEKESRVVEILAAAIPLRDLLWGKIIANSVLALGQVAATAAAAILTLWATDQTGVLDIVTGTVGWYLAFFVLGFVALAGVWAVAGSMAARQQDLNSTTMPVTIVLFVPYFLSTMGNEGLNTVMSMVPISSAMVMPARMAAEDVPLWQAVTSLGLNVVATVLLVALAAKVYERTVMRTERVTGFRELLRRSS